MLKELHPKNYNKPQTREVYRLRRLLAVAALGMAALTGRAAIDRFEHVYGQNEPILDTPYVVQPGDTLADIAADHTPASKNYLQTMHVLVEKYGENKQGLIHPGQVIMVPHLEPEHKTESNK